MENAFGEKKDIRVVVKKKSWPIRIAMKCGAKTESQATLVMVVITLLLITVAFFTFRGQPSVEIIDPEKLSNAQIQELINRGINTDDFSPEQKRELIKRGIDI